MTNPTQSRAGVQPGDVLAGKYRVERVLGAGGMGVVVAAHHIQLDEKVALKFLLPEALGSPDAVARFLREARAAVKIKSEHVARVADVGQLDNGSPYIVMEYLEGRDLAGWLELGGAMPVEQAVDFVLQASEAIAEAHALGIVHRDLKPANLFCVLRADRQPSVKVLDFGISKMTHPGEPSQAMTNTSAVVGSPLYMSPEQLRSSKGVDTRTDIWSLGVILFELLTTKAPFTAETVSELIIRIATEPAPPIRSLRADVPPGLERVIATCLEKERDRRFASVGEMAVALRDFGSRNAAGSVERILGTLQAAGITGPRALSTVRDSSGAITGPAAHASAPQTGATWGRTGETTGASGGARVAVWIGATVFVVATVVGGGFAWKRFGPQTAASSATQSAPAPAPASALASASAPAAQLETAPAASPGASPASSAVATPALPAAASPHHAPRTHPQAPVEPPPANATPAAAGAARPAAKPNCNPPYVIDSAGYRQYKPECL
jgi:eukaryotic-like serine/threonine-protein kinase